ncbi:MAG: SCO family protein [Bacteroidota bacterium]
MKLVGNVNILMYLSFLLSCSIQQNESSTVSELPYLGPVEFLQVMKSGEKTDSLIHHKVPPFELQNQYGDTFGSEDLEGKVYLAEFFFTSCPSVCPLVAPQMTEIHKKLQDEKGFALVSFTLDSEWDTHERLFDFAEKGTVNHSNWFFLTGAKDSIYRLASEGYYVAAYKDPSRSEDNIMHNGTLVLVDQNGNIRGMFDGKERNSIEKIEMAVKQLRIK